ncbi:MAG: glycosyltransferase family 39 protein [Proteobacteria bacterium]|nr:glycosyltransferase family 39 protein [Pseudomonadota bacterium]
MNDAKTEEQRLYRLALGVVGAITLIRVLILIVGRLEIHPDEGQYWWWAQTPAFGYFSKPPMIAWIIWLTTSVFGDGEWALRIGSPLLHAGAALLLFGIGRLAYGARVGLLSAIAYVTLPGVSYSSCLISTDVPLLFFWALALYAFLRALYDRRWIWVIVCGLAVGGGLLSKYAMFYFVAGAVLAGLAVPKVRALVFSRRGFTILAIGLLLLMPNIVWNVMHGFPTVAHTEVNANWGHARYNLMNALDFLAGQFGVFGPLMMAGLLWIVWRLACGSVRDPSDVMLAAFALPPLVLMFGQAFISDANANWGATAYIAATPLVVNALLKLWKARVLWASLGFHALAEVAMWAIMVSPPFADSLGVGNAFKRMEGWRELGQAVLQESRRSTYVAIVAANRSVIAELVYYARGRVIPMRMWDKDTHDDDHFQMTMRLKPGTPHVLLVIAPDEDVEVLSTFRSATPIRTIVIPIGGHRQRIAQLYDARDYLGPQTH